MNLLTPYWPPTFPIGRNTSYALCNILVRRCWQFSNEQINSIQIQVRPQPVQPTFPSIAAFLVAAEG
jgi:hypothetical protein